MTTRGLCRIGFVIPKYGRSAVDRNRLKRSVRELARIRILGALRADASPTGMDIVMRALPSAYRASFDELRAEVDSLQAKLMRLLATYRSGASGGRAKPAGE
jgi:ribonuclease P protein component